MTITLTTPKAVTLKEATVNHFEIPMFRFENPASGPVVTVSCNASLRTTEGDVTTESGLVNLPDLVYSGARLWTIMGDAMTRAQAFAGASVPGPLALYQGVRDALYAALQADGVIPAA